VGESSSIPVNSAGVDLWVGITACRDDHAGYLMQVTVHLP